jgi:hypothetical protein
MEIASPALAQVRDAAFAYAHHRAGLSARLDVDGLFTIQGRYHQLGAEGGGGHGQRHTAVQVVALATEDLVVTFVHFDVEVTRRATAGPDFTLAVEADTHAVLDTSRDFGR